MIFTLSKSKSSLSSGDTFFESSAVTFAHLGFPTIPTYFCCKRFLYSLLYNKIRAILQIKALN